MQIEQDLHEAVFGLTFVALDPDGHRIRVCISEPNKKPAIIKLNHSISYKTEQTMTDLDKIMCLLLADECKELDASLPTGASPIMIAAQEGHSRIVKYLSKKGANINKQSNTGRTVLSIAVSNNNINLVKLSIEEKADVNLYNAERETPLHIAVHQANQELNTKFLSSSPTYSIIKLLIDAGADMDILDHNGKKAMDYANETVKIYIQQILKAKEFKTPAENSRFFKYELGNNLIRKNNNPIPLPKIVKNQPFATIRTSSNKVTEQDDEKHQTSLKYKNSGNLLIRYGLYATVTAASIFIIERLLLKSAKEIRP